MTIVAAKVEVAQPGNDSDGGWPIDGRRHAWDCDCGGCSECNEMLDGAERVVEEELALRESMRAWERAYTAMGREDAEFDARLVKERLAEWSAMTQAEKDRRMEASRQEGALWQWAKSETATITPFSAKLKRWDEIMAGPVTDEAWAHYEKVTAATRRFIWGPSGRPPAEPEPEPESLLGGRPLSYFEAAMDGSAPPPPEALLERKPDGATLFYEGEVNWLYGPPGTGKTWLAWHIIDEALQKARRVIYWDHEASPGSAQIRAKLIGLDLAWHWQEGRFKYLRSGPQDEELAMAEAQAWVAGGDGPTLIVIDSATSAGCPSDGGDVRPWIQRFIRPFKPVGVNGGPTVLVLDHVPKQRKGSPPGPIGSTHKLAAVEGAALALSGTCWTEQTNGILTIKNEKDRYGQLPAPQGKAVARVKGSHVNGSIHIEIGAPQAEDDIEESFLPTLQALAAAGPNGVDGQQAMRDLVTGRTSKRDITVAKMIEDGYIDKDTTGRRNRYCLSTLGYQMIEHSDSDEDEGE